MNSLSRRRQSTSHFFGGIFRAVWISGAICLLSACSSPVKPGPRADSAPAPESNPIAMRAARPIVSTNTLILPAAGLSLFDGKSLTGWVEADFAGHGETRVAEGKLILGMGVMTGVTWTNPVPRTNYELELDAMRVEGSDFFCGLTFPVGESPCSLIVGGWGGGVVGLSNLDGEDAAHNETTKFLSFEKGRWYHIRLRVAPATIQAWIDDEKVVDVVTTDRTISIRAEVELSRPLGFATWSTTGALRNIRLRPL